MNSGIELQHIDPDVRPADDLFGHVNGRWLATTEIPADRSREGEFMRLHDQAERDVRAIIERLSTEDHPTGSDEYKIAVLYRDFMDEAAVEANGVTPIAGQLADIDALTTRDELIELIGSLQRIGVGGPVHAWVDTDSADSSHYILNLSQGGICLPDESYYREEQFEPIRQAYRAHVRRMLELAGVPDADRQAEAVFALESRLAAAHWNRTDVRDVSKTYNRFTRAQLAELTPVLDWNAWLAGAEAPESALAEVVVRQPSFAQALSDTLAEQELDVWKSWLRWSVVHAAAPFLTAEIVAENFAFYGTTLTGAPELRERWKRGVSLVESAIGEAVGRIYVDQHFPPESKEHMERLVEAIIRAYGENMKQLPWMTEATKQRALEKLAAFTPKIGYPDKWRDYRALRFEPADLLGNVWRANSFETDRELAKLGTDVDRSEWFMLPQTVNAYYNPGMNEIVFPAAILQPPFFDPDAEDAVNFGGIGAVIAHEIGHGFDDQGSKYDGAGNLHNWWTDDDRAAFDQRAEQLIEQFNQYEPLEVPGEHVNGALTVGENIGDLGGLTIALRAYQLSLDGQEAPEIDGLTGLQRLFFGWAQVWRGKNRPEEAKRLLTIDPHSPMDARCNGIVRNLDEFYESFDVTESDRMWLAPEERVAIW